MNAQEAREYSERLARVRDAMDGDCSHRNIVTDALGDVYCDDCNRRFDDEDTWWD